jgi:hypothetical protein
MFTLCGLPVSAMVAVARVKRWKGGYFFGSFVFRCRIFSLLPFLRSTQVDYV